MHARYYILLLLHIADICGLPPATGICNAAFQRFFYNRTAQRCELFIWGGCGGNANNFMTREDCERTCGSGKALTATVNISLNI